MICQNLLIPDMIFVVCLLRRINICAPLKLIWMLKQEQELTRIAVVKSTMFQRVVRWKTMVGMCVSTAVVLSLLLLALLRSDDVHGGLSLSGGDEGQQLEDSTRRRPSFLVDTPGCKIPNIDPFDSSIRHLVAANNVSLLCNATPPIT